MENLEVGIIYNKEAGPGYFLLGLDWRPPAFKAGQFVMLRVSDGLDPLLRRPFGIYRVMSGGKGVELLYQVVGKGTRILSLKRPGERLGLLGPLGNGFTMPPKAAKVVLVAGGMGIVPLYPFAHEVRGAVLLYGTRDAAQASVAGDFKELGCPVRHATEDGSLGVKGYVTELLKDELTRDAMVYACGPAPMLKAVAAIAGAAGARCYVSLERSMACGIGVCLGCAVKGRVHADAENKLYKMVCSDGPVFESGEIDWEAF